MFNINQLLERVRALRDSDIGMRTAVCSALKKNLPIEILVEHIKVKPPKVFVSNLSQGAKSEIFIKKAQILADINAALGGDRIHELLL